MHRSKYRRLVSEIADREQRHFQSAMPARVLR
jgi:hypothetical protein